MTRTTLPLLIGSALMLGACTEASEPQLAIMNASDGQLPAWAERTGLLPLGDLTHLADADDLTAYASRDDDGSWCVVLAIEPASPESDWVTTANCAPPQTFAEDGVRVDAATPQWAHGGAWVLPDNFAGEVAGDWERVSDNLAIRRLERPG